MLIEMVKGAGGVFVPADDMTAGKLMKFRNGEVYPVEVKLSRNPQFHRKAFAFFKFCFEYWRGEKADLEFMDESAQFNTFRKNLTVLAGYKDITYTIDGRMRVEAKSLSYGEMEQPEFEECYSALINAALKHIFGNTRDQNVINQLYSFF